MTSELFIWVPVKLADSPPGSPRAWRLELRHLEFLAPKGVHHPDRAQPLLRHGQHVALALLDGRRLRADALRVEIDRAAP